MVVLEGRGRWCDLSGDIRGGVSLFFLFFLSGRLVRVNGDDIGFLCAK